MSDHTMLILENKTRPSRKQLSFGNKLLGCFPLISPVSKAVSRVPNFTHWQQLDSTARHPLLVARYRSFLLGFPWAIGNGWSGSAFGDSLACSPHCWHSHSTCHSRLILAQQRYTALVVGPEFLQMVKPLAVCSTSFHATQCGAGNCRSRILEEKFL